MLLLYTKKATCWTITRVLSKGLHAALKGAKINSKKNIHFLWKSRSKIHSN